MCATFVEIFKFQINFQVDLELQYVLVVPEKLKFKVVFYMNVTLIFGVS